MNELWPKFIERAVTKHVLTYQDVPWQIGDDLTSDSKKFCELRTDGPWFWQNGKNLFHCEFEVNVLIHVVDAKIYEIEQIGGEILKLLAQSISIVDDNGVTLGCANPMYDRYHKLQFNKFGVIAVDTNAEQATVENRYKVELEGVST